METKAIRFHGRKLNDPEVIQRLQQNPQVVKDRVDRINDRMALFWPSFVGRINDLVNLQGVTSDYKIPALWKIVDEMMSFNNGDVACKDGCSHCCHIPVLLPHAEAEVIGKRIGRKPQRAKVRIHARDVQSGYQNPCAFLVDNRCSIYENRPMVCRAHYNVDIDSLMCELADDGAKVVPYLNDRNYQMALLYIVESTTGNVNCGEIREFWPK